MEAKHAFKDSWDDDQRMLALFAEFRNPSLNPEGWNRKMSEWINAVNSLCTTNHKLTLTIPSLQASFERNRAQPQCLHTVTEEMGRQGLLISTAELQKKLSNQSWVSWGLDWFVKKPFSFGLSYVQQSLFGASQPSPVEYVHLGVLQELSNETFKRFQAKIERENLKTMLDVKHFHSECQDLCSEYRMFLLVLSHLEFQGKVAILNQDGCQYLKIKSTAMPKPELTETDIGVAKLQKALNQIQTEIAKIESDVNICKEDARVAIRNNNRSKAEALLRKKQRFEKQLNTKLKSAENIENMLDQLETSFANSDVLNALKAGTNAQKRITSKMNIDKVEDTMNDVEEAFDEQNEIGEILSRKLAGTNCGDDEDLEAELDALLELDQLDEKLVDPRTLPNISISDDAEDVQLPNVPDDKLPSKEKVAMNL